MTEAPRLFLITPVLSEAQTFVRLCETVLDEVDVACLLIRTPSGDEPTQKQVVRALAPIAQARECAVLIEGEPRQAARLGVDGVHVPTEGAALAEAIAALKPDRIVGAGPFSSRDDAMRAGEAGADYVLFGGPGQAETPETVLSRVAWWAEIFNVPCVGYVPRLDLAADMARAGAEFIALCEGLWEAPDGVAAALRDLNRVIDSLEETLT